MVTQPDHGQIAGYLAAHWGNDEFNAPGYFYESSDHDRLRDEIVLGVSEHDNGWWEWEAVPELNENDGLPMNLTEFLHNLQEGMNRWRLGLPRFSEKHPYASLLMSFHAYWLYAQNVFDNPDPEFLHPLVRKKTLLDYTLEDEKIQDAKNFITELENMQSGFISKVKEDPETAHWVEEQHLKPNARFLQIMDALSLSLCSNLIPANEGESSGLGEDQIDFDNVPRKSWEDRVTIKMEPKGNKKIVCEPYPFNIDPLPVSVPTRIFNMPIVRPSHFQTEWHSHPVDRIEYEYSSS